MAYLWIVCLNNEPCHGKGSYAIIVAPDLPGHLDSLVRSYTAYYKVMQDSYFISGQGTSFPDNAINM